MLNKWFQGSVITEIKNLELGYRDLELVTHKEQSHWGLSSGPTWETCVEGEKVTRDSAEPTGAYSLRGHLKVALIERRISYKMLPDLAGCRLQKQVIVLPRSHCQNPSNLKGMEVIVCLHSRDLLCVSP